MNELNWKEKLVSVTRFRLVTQPQSLTTSVVWENYMPGTFSPLPIPKETASLWSRRASWHVRHARAMMHVGIASQWWRGKRSRHSRRMRKPQFCVSDKRSIACVFVPWWRHQMETFSASRLLAFCKGNSPVTGEFSSQKPVTRSFDDFFDLRLKKHRDAGDMGRHRAHYDVTVMPRNNTIQISIGNKNSCQEAWRFLLYRNNFNGHLFFQLQNSS